MKYLITGGAGFIGSHITEELVSRGETVTVFDNLETGKMENVNPFLDRIRFVKGDIRDLGLLLREMEGTDFVLHQAALRSVPKSVADPVPYFHVNVIGHYNVLEAARQNKIKGITFASSSSVYGNTDRFPQTEDQPTIPESPYAITKRDGESLCRFFHKTYGLNAISLRYFNVFGPRQSLENKYAVVIPFFIKRILEGKSPIIYGNGEQGRDFTYVKEVVRANLAALQAKNAGGEVFNVSEGKTITINELARKINEMLGKNIKPEYQSYRAGDVLKTQGSPAKAKEKLDFIVQTGFEEALQQTVNWFQSEASKCAKQE